MHTRECPSRRRITILRGALDPDLISSVATIWIGGKRDKIWRYKQGLGNDCYEQTGTSLSCLYVGCLRQTDSLQIPTRPARHLRYRYIPCLRSRGAQDAQCSGMTSRRSGKGGDCFVPFTARCMLLIWITTNKARGIHVFFASMRHFEDLVHRIELAEAHICIY
jgi:hypothetical protein